jgi:hypothetical protein
MSKEIKLANLEKKLNTATKLLESLDEIDDELGISKEIDAANNIPMIAPDNFGAVVPYDANVNEDVFTLQQLKQDFIMVRQNILSLVMKGQRVFDQVSILELSELKGSQIEAISALMKCISENTRSIIDIYKVIADIEKQKQSKAGAMFGADGGPSVNMGTVNQIMFTGTPNELLDILNPK